MKSNEVMHLFAVVFLPLQLPLSANWHNYSRTLSHTHTHTHTHLTLMPISASLGETCGHQRAANFCGPTERSVELLIIANDNTDLGLALKTEVF